MSNQYLKLRRSSVPGRVPTTESIDFGEIALNTHDGLAYMKVNGPNGIEVVRIGYNSGSFSGSFIGDFIGTFTGSLQGTASWAENYNETDPIFTAVSGTFTTTSSFNAFTASYYSDSSSFDSRLENNSSSIAVLSSSFTSFSSSYNTGSFSGSFVGDLNGTASWATNALTASFAPAYLPLTGGTINGDVTLNGTASIAFLNVTIQSSSIIYSSGSNVFGDSTQDTQTLIGTVLVSGSQSITGSLNVSQGITGSLLGTSSWAEYAITASYADSAQTASFVTSSNVHGPYGANSILSASYAVSSSIATSASFAQTSSFALRAISSSYAQTASYSQNLVISGSISTVDYIDFNTVANPSHLEGRIHWNSDTKTIQIDTDRNNFSIDTGHQSVVRVYNATGADITAGKLVYINGAQGNTPTITLASWEIDPTSAGTIGFAATTIPGTGGNRHGYVVTNGLLTNVNTNGFAVGTRLYLSSSGQFTDTAPDAPLHEVRLGVVIVNNATTGVIYVNVVNGFELTELHDVKTTTESTGDLLVRSGSLWINSKQLNGNYQFTGNQTISGSLIVRDNLTVLGSASVTYISESTLNIGTNLITVNTITPGARFGGLAVIDSGSSPLVSASFLYDSVQDEFIFVHKGTAGGAITSSHFVLGPETYNDLGNETYLTANRIPKGTGIEHIVDSNISDNGSVVSINSNTQVTGSLIATQGITGSLFGTASFATTASFALNIDDGFY